MYRNLFKVTETSTGVEYRWNEMLFGTRPQIIKYFTGSNASWHCHQNLHFWFQIFPRIHSLSTNLKVIHICLFSMKEPFILLIQLTTTQRQSLSLQMYNYMNSSVKPVHDKRHCNPFLARKCCRITGDKVSQSCYLHCEVIKQSSAEVNLAASELYMHPVSLNAAWGNVTRSQQQLIHDTLLKLVRCKDIRVLWAL